jgi:hypothetical protein
MRWACRKKHIKQLYPVIKEMHMTYRRQFTLAALAAMFSACRDAWATSPPPPPPPPTLKELLMRADLVVVATVKRFVYRGGSLTINRHELDQDFEEDNGEGNRTLDALAKVNRVVFQKKIPARKLLRINQPIHPNLHHQLLNVQKIYLLVDRFDYKSVQGIETVFNVLTAPLPIGELSSVLKTLSEIHPTKK